MITKSHLRRVATSATVTGLVTTGVLAVTMPTAHAHELSPRSLVKAAPAITTQAMDLALEVERGSGLGGPGAQAAPAAAKVGRQPIVPGVRLEAKPNPWVLPVVGYHLTARFGMVSGLWSHFHTGLDFAAPTGTEIHSIAPGVVLTTGFDGAYGNKTEIRLADGTVLWYCHQNSIAVQTGQRVEAGELIGYVGSTGNTTGPHLHLEVHPHGGAPIDPEKWLPLHHLHP